MHEAITNTMLLEERHFDALNTAERLMFHSDLCPYLELKGLLADSDPQARRRFRSLFITFYGLNVGGLTEEFKDKFFEILHSGDVFLNDRPDYRRILLELRKIKRKKGDNVLHFSFVSKLIAVHRESCPIYDSRVLAFFQTKAPPPSIGDAARIDWYLSFLGSVTTSYEAWVGNPKVASIVERLKRRDSQLATCHPVRLMDFLVWKVGNQRLLPN